MICLLTSDPIGRDGGGLNPANGFVDALADALDRQPVRGLFVASSPDAPAINEFYAAEQKRALENGGIVFSAFDILDRRNADCAPALVRRSGLIVLTGGHVPTQNRFFHDIDLKTLLKDFDGVVVGISAGTMNAAETVYAQPELEGEAINPNYQRFLPGLGLTRAMVIPHFDGNLFASLDGLRLYGDITLPDSVGRRFWLLTDGSYILVRDGVETLCGEAWLIEGGALRPAARNGERLRL